MNQEVNRKVAREMAGKALFAAMMSAIFLDLRLAGERVHRMRFIKKKLAKRGLQKRYRKQVDAVRDEFRSYGVKVIDPHKHLSQAAESLLAVSTDENGLSDAAFLELMHQIAEDLPDSKREVVFAAAVAVCRLDGRLQDEEREVLEMMRDALEVDVDIDAIAEKVTRDRQVARFFRFSLVLVTVTVVAAGYILLREYQAFNKPAPPIGGSRDLVFAEVDFSRYVIAGNRIRNEHLHKGVVFHVKGTAEVAANFEALSLDCEERGWPVFVRSLLGKPVEPPTCRAVFDVSKTMPGLYRGGGAAGLKANGIPMLVRFKDVHWKQLDEIRPKPVSTASLQGKLPKIIGAAAFLGGGIMAARSTASDGGAFSKLIESALPELGVVSTIGRVVVTGVAASASGYGAYVATKETLALLDGLELADGLSEREKGVIKQAALSDVAAELADDEQMSEWYATAIEESVRRIYAGLGVKITGLEVR